MPCRDYDIIKEAIQIKVNDKEKKKKFNNIYANKNKLDDEEKIIMEIGSLILHKDVLKDEIEQYKNYLKNNDV